MDKRAKLPGLPTVSTGNPSLDRWIQSATERFEVREGARGDGLEQVLTKRDALSMGLSADGKVAKMQSSQFSGVMVHNEGGSGVVPFEVFADEIRKTKLYQSLLLKLDDATRFNDVPEKVRELLLKDIADEASKRGADVSRVEYKLQGLEESLAYKLEEVTAAVATASSGVREMTYANATANSATAGQVTQVKARLDGTAIASGDILPTVYATLAALQAAVPVGVAGKYYQVAPRAVTDPVTPNTLYKYSGGAYSMAAQNLTATLEQQMAVAVDRTTGLSSKYTIKVNAGGAVAGFGLAAEDNLAGGATSSFVVQADKFAVQIGSFAARSPFYVDATGAYFTSDVRIDGNLLVTGSITSGKLGAGSVSTSNFSSGIEPIGVVSSVPSVLSTKLVFNSADGKMYRWNGSAYISTTAAADISGTIADSQIAALAASKITGSLSDSQLASIAAAKLTGTIVGTQIADGSISTAKISAGQITSALIAADTITSGNIAASAITSTELAAGSVVAGKIAAGTIVAADIAAGTITAGNIAAGTITANEMAANSITSGKIAAGIVTAANMATGALSASNITTGTLTGSIIQTAVSGARAVISPSSMIQCYNSSGIQVEIGGPTGIIWASAGSILYSTIAGVSTGALSGVVAQNTGTGNALAAYSSGTSYAGYMTRSTDGPSALITNTYSGSPRWNSHGLRVWTSSISTCSALIALGQSNQCFYAEAGTFGPFTASHDAVVLKTHSTEPGDIMVDVSLVTRNGLSDAVFLCEKSSLPSQKAAIGICNTRNSIGEWIPAAFIDRVATDTAAELAKPKANSRSLRSNHSDECKNVAKEIFTTLKADHDLLTVNAIGEGHVNVCGEGGDIEAGDLIVTSSIPGKGKRQADDIVRSITVAKARESIAFSGPTEVKQVACIYLCG